MELTHLLAGFGMVVSTLGIFLSIQKKFSTKPQGEKGKEQVAAKDKSLSNFLNSIFRSSNIKSMIWVMAIFAGVFFLVYSPNSSDNIGENADRYIFIKDETKSIYSDNKLSKNDSYLISDERLYKKMPMNVIQVQGLIYDNEKKELLDSVSIIYNNNTILSLDGYYKISTANPYPSNIVIEFQKKGYRPVESTIQVDSLEARHLLNANIFLRKETRKGER